MARPIPQVRTRRKKRKALNHIDQNVGQANADLLQKKTKPRGISYSAISLSDSPFAFATWEKNLLASAKTPKMSNVQGRETEKRKAIAVNAATQVLDEKEGAAKRAPLLSASRTDTMSAEGAKKTKNETKTKHMADRQEQTLRPQAAAIVQVKSHLRRGQSAGDTEDDGLDFCTVSPRPPPSGRNVTHRRKRNRNRKPSGKEERDEGTAQSLPAQRKSPSHSQQASDTGAASRPQTDVELKKGAAVGDCRAASHPSDKGPQQQGANNADGDTGDTDTKHQAVDGSGPLPPDSNLDSHSQQKQQNDTEVQAEQHSTTAAEPAPSGDGAGHRVTAAQLSIEKVDIESGQGVKHPDGQTDHDAAGTHSNDGDSECSSDMVIASSGSSSCMEHVAEDLQREAGDGDCTESDADTTESMQILDKTSGEDHRNHHLQQIFERNCAHIHVQRTKSAQSHTTHERAQSNSAFQSLIDRLKTSSSNAAVGVASQACDSHKKSGITSSRCREAISSVPLGEGCVGARGSEAHGKRGTVDEKDNDDHNCSNEEEEDDDDASIAVWSLDDDTSIPTEIHVQGRRFVHPALPPGWTVHTSKTRDRPYYKHPDFGSTWHCPVILPLKMPGHRRSLISVRDEKADMEDDNTNGDRMDGAIDGIRLRPASMTQGGKVGQLKPMHLVERQKGASRRTAARTNVLGQREHSRGGRHSPAQSDQFESSMSDLIDTVIEMKEQHNARSSRVNLRVDSACTPIVGAAANGRSSIFRRLHHADDGTTPPSAFGATQASRPLRSSLSPLQGQTQAHSRLQSIADPNPRRGRHEAIRELEHNPAASTAVHRDDRNSRPPSRKATINSPLRQAASRPSTSIAPLPNVPRPRRSLGPRSSTPVHNTNPSRSYIGASMSRSKTGTSGAEAGRLGLQSHPDEQCGEGGMYDGKGSGNVQQQRLCNPRTTSVEQSASPWTPVVPRLIFGQQSDKSAAPPRFQTKLRGNVQGPGVSATAPRHTHDEGRAARQTTGSRSNSEKFSFQAVGTVAERLSKRMLRPSSTVAGIEQPHPVPAVRGLNWKPSVIAHVAAANQRFLVADGGAYQARPRVRNEANTATVDDLSAALAKVAISPALDVSAGGVLHPGDVDSSPHVSEYQNKDDKKQHQSEDGHPLRDHDVHGHATPDLDGGATDDDDAVGIIGQDEQLSSRAEEELMKAGSDGSPEDDLDLDAISSPMQHTTDGPRVGRGRLSANDDPGTVPPVSDAGHKGGGPTSPPKRTVEMQDGPKRQDGREKAAAAPQSPSQSPSALARRASLLPLPASVDSKENDVFFDSMGGDSPLSIDCGNRHDHQGNDTDFDYDAVSNSCGGHSGTHRLAKRRSNATKSSMKTKSKQVSEYVLRQKDPLCPLQRLDTIVDERGRRRKRDRSARTLADYFTHVFYRPPPRSKRPGKRSSNK